MSRTTTQDAPFRPARHRACGLVLFTLLGLGSLAQVAVKVMQIRPTGEFGEVMERKVMAEALYMDDFEGRLRPRFSLGLVSMEPQLEKIPVSAYVYNGSTDTVYHGYQSFSKYRMVLIAGGLDWEALDLDPVRIYPGLGVVFGTIKQEYEIHIPNYENESYAEGNFFAGLRVLAGIEYSFSEPVAAFAEFSRDMYLVAYESGGYEGQGHNAIGGGLRVMF